MAFFRKLCIHCWTKEDCMNADKLASSLGYSAKENKKTALDEYEKQSADCELDERGHLVIKKSDVNFYLDKTLFIVLMLHGDGTFEANVEIVRGYWPTPTGYRQVNPTYRPTSKYDAPNIQVHLAKELNMNQKTCFATDEIGLSHGRADVFEARWDRTLCEYEVKVTKADFDGEFATIKSIVSGDFKLEDCKSKVTKHATYLKGEGGKGDTLSAIIPNYFYFVVTPELAEYCKKSLKGTPYGLVIVDGSEKDEKVSYSFTTVKVPRKIPGHKPPKEEALWMLMFSFGARAKSGRNRIDGSSFSENGETVYNTSV